MNFFSKNLKYLRTMRKMSRSELADKIKVNQSTISRWENEDMGVTVDNAYDVATALNIPLPDLLGRDLSIDSFNNELDNLLFSKAKTLTDEEKKAVLQVMDAIHKDVDKELDNK